MKNMQMSDSFVTGSILALVGGFLDVYTYICRGHVFANAQTGNIVLLGVELSEKDFAGVAFYIAPIIAFIVGIIIANIIKIRFKEYESIYWKQIIVLLEGAVLIVVANIPMGELDTLANIMISFVCSLQVETFRKVNGYAYASTMCTGNLRSATKSMFDYFVTKDIAKLKAGMQYYGIIMFFIIGAALGAIITAMCSVKAIYVAVVALLLVAVMMFKKSEK